MTQQQKEAGLKAFHYDLVIHAENAAQADRVMVERTGYDEDLSEYGVGEYTIDADPAGGRTLAPVEVKEEKKLPPVISPRGEAVSVNAGQYLSTMHINTALNSGFRLPEARLISTASAVVELDYGDGRIRLDEDGELLSMEMRVDGAWTDMEGSPLHRKIVDALAAARSES